MNVASTCLTDGEKGEAAARTSRSVVSGGVMQIFAEHLESTTDADDGDAAFCGCEDRCFEAGMTQPVEVIEGVL